MIMNAVLVVFAFTTAHAGSPAAPRATQVTAVTVARPHADPGARRQLRLTTDRFEDVTAYVLTSDGPAPSRLKRVIPPSLARAIERDVRAWQLRLARAPAALTTVGCGRSIAIFRERRSTSLCLDRVAPGARREFFAWLAKTEAWLE